MVLGVVAGRQPIPFASRDSSSGRRYRALYASRQQRLEIMRQLALMRVDLSDTNFAANTSLGTLVAQCQALLDGAPNQTLQLTVVEFVQGAPAETSASGIAVSDR